MGGASGRGWTRTLKGEEAWKCPGEKKHLQARKMKVKKEGGGGDDWFLEDADTRGIHCCWIFVHAFYFTEMSEESMKVRAGSGAEKGR